MNPHLLAQGQKQEIGALCSSRSSSFGLREPAQARSMCADTCKQLAQHGLPCSRYLKQTNQSTRQKKIKQSNSAQSSPHRYSWLRSQLPNRKWRLQSRPCAMQRCMKPNSGTRKKCIRTSLLPGMHLCDLCLLQLDLEFPPLLCFLFCMQLFFTLQLLDLHQCLRVLVLLFVKQLCEG